MLAYGYIRTSELNIGHFPIYACGADFLTSFYKSVGSGRSDCLVRVLRLCVKGKLGPSSGVTMTRNTDMTADPLLGTVCHVREAPNSVMWEIRA
jgi:hypothetical protein